MDFINISRHIGDPSAAWQAQAWAAACRGLLYVTFPKSNIIKISCRIDLRRAKKFLGSQAW
jgi:hypothetical protein